MGKFSYQFEIEKTSIGYLRPILGVVPTVGPYTTNSMLVDWLFGHFIGLFIALLKQMLTRTLKPITDGRLGSIELSAIIFRRFVNELLVSIFVWDVQTTFYW